MLLKQKTPVGKKTGVFYAGASVKEVYLQDENLPPLFLAAGWGYFPVNCGARFSTKAFMPSF